jgi:hypothetical protein
VDPSLTKEHDMSKHLVNTAESTRRALRTLLQAAGAVATFIVAVAIPPVADAINAVLGLLPGVAFEVSPGVVAAVGLVGAALTALVSKLQNLYEGRDQYESPESLAVEVMELAELVDALIDAGRAAGVEVQTVLAQHGYELTED